MQELICDGAPTTDTDLWRAEQDNFCKERFQDDTNTLEQQEQIIRNLGFCPHRLDSNKHLIPNSELQQSRATMRHNKATDKKGIAKEMLHSISYHSRQHFTNYFNQYHNNQTHSPLTWNHTYFNGISKNENTNTLPGQGWIASQAMTRGWYQRANRDNMRRHYNTNSPVRSYGFKRRPNTRHITGWVRSIIRNCSMCKGYQAVIISMDINMFPDALNAK